jgi:hypothetical protein
MAVAQWMAGTAGPAPRVLVGLDLIGVGLYFQGTRGIVIAVVGVLPVLAGISNFCLIAPLLGEPFRGRPARAEPIRPCPTGRRALAGRGGRPDDVHGQHGHPAWVQPKVPDRVLPGT